MVSTQPVVRKPQDLSSYSPLLFVVSCMAVEPISRSLVQGCSVSSLKLFFLASLQGLLPSARVAIGRSEIAANLLILLTVRNDLMLYSLHCYSILKVK